MQWLFSLCIPTFVFDTLFSSTTIAFRHLLFISVVPTIIFFFISPVLFGFVLGKDWVVAGQYAQIMVVMFFLQFITSPLTNLFDIAEKQEVYLTFQIVRIILCIVSMYIGYRFFDDIKVSLLFYTVFFSLYNIAAAIYLSRLTVKTGCKNDL